jgi:uncharacterized protein (TIGR00661 family)
VVGVVAGRHANRSWPGFFEQGFDEPVTPLASPGFAYRGQRRVDLSATLWHLVRRVPAFRKSLGIIDDLIARTGPDLIINFLEPLMGWHGGGRSGVPVLAVGHQYMLEHPTYPRLAEARMSQWGLRCFVRASGRATMRYALSFYEVSEPLNERVMIAPPLLRDDLLGMGAGRSDGPVLGYLLNSGYLGELEEWQMRHPTVPVTVFCDRPGAPVREERKPGFVVHQLDARLFMECMAGARAVVCSAGFESLSEAAWLGKPALAVPVEGHIEQMLNAHDFERAGLGLAARKFDLDRLLGWRPGDGHERFAAWVRRSDECLDGAVRRVLELGGKPAAGDCGAILTKKFGFERESGTDPA